MTSMLDPIVEDLDAMLNQHGYGRILVGLGHTAQVGKDTAAEVLIDKLGFERVSIADMIRKFMEEINPIIEMDRDGNVVRVMDALEAEEMRGSTRAEAWETIRREYPEVRPFQQEVGRTSRKMFGSDVWVNPLDEYLQDSDHRRFVLTDVRFPSEVALVRSFDGPVIKVTRPDTPPLEHETDLALADYEGWDEVLDNNGTVEEIQYKLINAIGNFYVKDWTS